jgi:hypothetical protein
MGATEVEALLDRMRAADAGTKWVLVPYSSTEQFYRWATPLLETARAESITVSVFGENPECKWLLRRPANPANPVARCARNNPPLPRIKTSLEQEAPLPRHLHEGSRVHIESCAGFARRLASQRRGCTRGAGRCAMFFCPSATCHALTLNQLHPRYSVLCPLSTLLLTHHYPTGLERFGNKGILHRWMRSLDVPSVIETIDPSILVPRGYVCTSRLELVEARRLLWDVDVCIKPLNGASGVGIVLYASDEQVETYDFPHGHVNLEECLALDVDEHGEVRFYCTPPPNLNPSAFARCTHNPTRP